jgi:hypothetical protein
MIHRTRVQSLWPDPRDDDAHDGTIDSLFAEDAHSRTGLRDRHGCTVWYGPIVMFLLLPSIGSTSVDLLMRADPHAFVDVVKVVIRELKRRAPNREPRQSLRTAEDLATLEAVSSAYKQCGRELPAVSAAFRRLVDESLWCAGFAMPELRGTSESHILRSLGLSVDNARNLITARKPS